MTRPLCTPLQLCLVVVAALSVATRADAQGNAFGAPIGGRSALMGNTGVALAVDGSAPFLNPATIVRLDEHRFAFSVNFYQYAVTRFDGWHQPGPVNTGQFGTLALPDTGISSSGFNGLPSTLCLFFTTNDGGPPDMKVGPLVPWRQKLSICLASLESQALSFTALPFTGTTPLGQTSQTQSFVQNWNRLYAGPSYSMALTERLALGVSVHAVFTSDSFILNSGAITASSMNGGVQSSFGAAASGSSLDVATTLGGVYEFGPYTAAVSLALPAVHLTGSLTGTLFDAYGSGASSSATLASGSGTFTAAPPMRVALGLGAKWERLILEGDASLDLPAPTGFSAALTGTSVALASSSLTSTPLHSSFSVNLHPVVNAGVGAELFVKPTLSVIGGVSMNLTAQPPLSPTLTVGNLVQRRQSLATASAGVGSYGTSGNLVLGVQLGYGWGQSLAVNPYVTPNDLAVVDTTSYSVLVILAGSTSLRALGRAVERVEHVIVGNPTDPDAPPPPPPPTPGPPPPPGAALPTPPPPSPHRSP